MLSKSCCCYLCQIFHHLNCSHITLVHIISADSQSRHQTDKHEQTKTLDPYSKLNNPSLGASHLLGLASPLSLMPIRRAPVTYSSLGSVQCYIVCPVRPAMATPCHLIDLQAHWDQCPPNMLCTLIHEETGQCLATPRICANFCIHLEHSVGAWVLWQLLSHMLCLMGCQTN